VFVFELSFDTMGLPCALSSEIDPRGLRRVSSGRHGIFGSGLFVAILRVDLSNLDCVLLSIRRGIARITASVVFFKVGATERDPVVALSERRGVLEIEGLVEVVEIGPHVGALRPERYPIVDASEFAAIFGFKCLVRGSVRKTGEASTSYGQGAQG